MVMNLKKDEKLQSQEVWDHFQTVTDLDPITPTPLYLSIFPLFCL